MPEFKQHNALRSATLIAENKILMIDYTSDPKKEFIYYDLITKQFTTQAVHLPGAGWIFKFVVLDDPDLIAMGDDKGKLFILNLRTLKIEVNEQIVPIGVRDPKLTIHKNNHLLYGVSDNYFGALFFSGPANKSFSTSYKKITMHESVNCN